MSFGLKNRVCKVCKFLRLFLNITRKTRNAIRPLNLKLVKSFKLMTIRTCIRCMLHCNTAMLQFTGYDMDSKGCTFRHCIRSRYCMQFPKCFENFMNQSVHSMPTAFSPIQNLSYYACQAALPTPTLRNKRSCVRNGTNRLTLQRMKPKFKRELEFHPE